MPKRGRFTSVFFFFLLLSFFIYAVFQTGIGKSATGALELAIRPIQSGVFSVYAATQGKETPEQKVQAEILKLRSELVKASEQEKEIRALRDQFAVTSPSATSLLPTKIVGMKGFIPGYTLPEQIIIDKGQADGVKKGQPVIYTTYLLGTVRTAEKHLSVVDLTFKKGFSMTATTMKTGALGVVKGEGEGEMLLDNVLLSDSLTKDDQVITKGSISEDGTGTPQGLIIGKITSIDKKPSALFQSAKISRPLDVTKLSTVFLVLPTK